MVKDLDQDQKDQETVEGKVKEGQEEVVQVGKVEERKENVDFSGLKSDFCVIMKGKRRENR